MVMDHMLKVIKGQQLSQKIYLLASFTSKSEMYSFSLLLTMNPI